MHRQSRLVHSLHTIDRIQNLRFSDNPFLQEEIFSFESRRRSGAAVVLW